MISTLVNIWVRDREIVWIDLGSIWGGGYLTFRMGITYIDGFPASFASKSKWVGDPD